MKSVIGRVFGVQELRTGSHQGRRVAWATAEAVVLQTWLFAGVLSIGGVLCSTSWAQIGPEQELPGRPGGTQIGPAANDLVFDQLLGQAIVAREIRSNDGKRAMELYLAAIKGRDLSAYAAFRLSDFLVDDGAECVGKSESLWLTYWDRYWVIARDWVLPADLRDSGDWSNRREACALMSIVIDRQFRAGWQFLALSERKSVRSFAIAELRERDSKNAATWLLDASAALDERDGARFIQSMDRMRSSDVFQTFDEIPIPQEMSVGMQHGCEFEIRLMHDQGVFAKDTSLEDVVFESRELMLSYQEWFVAQKRVAEALVDFEAEDVFPAGDMEYERLRSALVFGMWLCRSK